MISLQGVLYLPLFIQVLVDDWGWADVGFHRKSARENRTSTAFDSEQELQTPTIDALVQQGVELQR